MEALLCLGTLALLHALTRLWIRASRVELRLGVLAAMRAAYEARLALVRDGVTPNPLELLRSLLSADRIPVEVGQRSVAGGLLVGWRIEDERRWS